MVSYCRTLAGNSMLEVKPTGPRDHVRNNIEHFCNFNFVLNLLCIMPLFQTMRCCDCLILDSLEFHNGWISGASFMFFFAKKRRAITLLCWHVPQIENHRLCFRETATPKCGSLENICHMPGGGDKKVVWVTCSAVIRGQLLFGWIW